MQRLVLEVTEMKRWKEGSATWFSLRGNGIKFAEKVDGPVTSALLKGVNESFRNSLRYVKHYGGYADDTVSDAEKWKALDKLTTTDTGIGIRIKDDPLKEFIPFQ